MMPRHTLDQTRPDPSVMRLAYCVHYKPDMLNNRTQSVYGQHQDVSGHRIMRDTCLTRKKRAVVEGTKKKEKEKKREAKHLYRLQ